MVFSRTGTRWASSSVPLNATLNPSRDGIPTPTPASVRRDEIGEAFRHYARGVEDPSRLLHRADLKSLIAQRGPSTDLRTVLPGQSGAKRAESLRLARSMASVVEPLNRLITSLEGLDRDTADGQDVHVAPAHPMDGLGASPQLAAFFSAVLDGLQPRETGAEALLLSAVTEDASLLTPASVAEGVYLLTHRSVRLRVERSYALLRLSLGNSLLTTEEWLEGAKEELSFPHSPAEEYYDTRIGFTLAQQWLLEEFMALYQSLVTGSARLQRSQRALEQQKGGVSGTAAGVQKSVSSSFPTPSTVVEDVLVVHSALLGFFQRLVGDQPLGAELQAARWSERLKHAQFFNGLPNSFPVVQQVALDSARPHHLIVELTNVQTPPHPALSKSLCGLFLTEEPSQRGPTQLETPNSLTTAFTSPAAVAPHVDPLLLVTERGRLLELLLRVSPLAARVTQCTTRSSGGEGRLVLTSPHFTRDLLRWAQREIQQLTSTTDGSFRQPRTWGTFIKECAALQRRCGGAAARQVTAAATTAGLDGWVAPPPLVAPPLPPPSDADAEGEGEGAEVLQAARCEDCGTETAALLPPSAAQEPVLEGVDGQTSHAYEPCCFANEVKLLWINHNSMILQRQSLQQPWGLAIECLVQPEAYPDRLPMQLVRLPPMKLIKAVKKEAPLHPFLEFFRSKPRNNWYIDTINGIAARHPDHSIPWMSTLTQMVLRFRRL